MIRRGGFHTRGLHALALLWALAASVCAVPALAQPRVWLDRERIALDETVTLNLEIDAKTIALAPRVVDLNRDFEIVDQQAQSDVVWANGALMARMTMQLTLAPRREGVIVIPSLWSGRDATRTLRLTVLPPRNPQAAVQPVPAVAEGRPVFIETRAETQTPYVQQTVGYTVRLYYLAGSILDGSLDQDMPQGANLQKVGDDLQLKARLGDRDYIIVERRYLLIPERSGAVTVPGARFQGRSLGLFDSIFDDSSRQELRLSSDPITLQVRPLPAASPQPWLPLSGLRLRYLEVPQALRVGQSAAITLEVVADGAIAAEMPALMLQAGNDAQVFADPPQVDDRFVQGRPQATIVRRFSVLPARDGTVRIVAPRIAWWDTQAGIARVATLPDLNLRVAPGASGTGRPAAQTADGAGGTADGSSSRGWRGWLPGGLISGGRWMWAGLALLWVGALSFGWWLWSRHGKTPAPAVSQPSPADAQALTRALTRGDPREIARALCAMASPPVADLEALRRRLVDPAQLAAVEALLRARWSRDDPAAAVAAVRIAFAHGPRWRAPPTPRPAVLLPPLYPER